MIVTQSETSDDAVQIFDSSMESLRKLDVAQEYMELLTEVESLRSLNDFKAMAGSNHTDMLYAALKDAATSRNLLKMLFSRTSGSKFSSMR